MRIRLDKNKGLTRAERQELVDLLRKNILYQTPRPIFADVDDEHPMHVDLRFLFHHQQRILMLLHKAGGWILPPEEKEKLLKQHEEAARQAHGNGIDYDFSHLDYGSLVNMYTELEGIDEMKNFREAIRGELSMWGEDGVRHG